MILFQKKNYSKYENKIHKMPNLQLHYSITNIKGEKKRKEKKEKKRTINKLITALNLKPNCH